MQIDGSKLTALTLSDLQDTNTSTVDADGDGSMDDLRIMFSDSSKPGFSVNIDLIDTADLGDPNTDGEFEAPNATPVVNVADTALAYSTGDPAVFIDDNATVSDADGDSAWDGGSVSAQITEGADANDVLSLGDVGGGVTLSISGTELRAWEPRPTARVFRQLRRSGGNRPVIRHGRQRQRLH